MTRSPPTPGSAPSRSTPRAATATTASTAATLPTSSRGGNNNDRIIPDDNPLNTLDVARGDAGDDTMVWNGGDDDDINDGGDGNDTTEVNGAPQGETFTVKPSTTAGRVRFDRTSTNPAPFSIDIGTTERLLLNANGGDDKIRTDKGLAGLIAGEFNGGDDNDVVEGTDSPDRLNGDKGHDVILAKDKAEDLLDCGPGLDLARVDKRDFLPALQHHHRRSPEGARRREEARGRQRTRERCRWSAPAPRSARASSRSAPAADARQRQVQHQAAVQDRAPEAERQGPPLSALGKSVSVHIDAKDTKGNGWRTTQKLKLTR